MPADYASFSGVRHITVRDGITFYQFSKSIEVPREYMQLYLPPRRDDTGVARAEEIYFRF